MIIPVQITAITVIGTELMLPKGDAQSFRDISLGDVVLWDRRCLRMLPPSWDINTQLHLIGGRWTDPDPEDGGTFVITGLSHGEEGVRVEYREWRAETSRGGDEDGENNDDGEVSTLAEVLRWLEGDFSDGDAADGDEDAADGLRRCCS